MMKNEIILGDVKVTVREINPYVVIELTGRENDKTIVKLSLEECEQLMYVIMNSECFEVDVRDDDVHIKHRGYNDNGIYSYYECRNATIRIYAMAGHCIISIFEPVTKYYYRNISFKVREYREQLEKFKDHVNNMIFDCI